MGAALSSRIYLKQQNTEIENAMLSWAEPFSVFASLLGMEYPRRYLELAWKYLLWNQAHDSIAGCCQDIVHEDMMYYFNQTREITDVVTRRALCYIASNINTKNMNRDSFSLIVFNPHRVEISDVVSATVDIPSKQNCDSLTIVDDNADKIDVQIDSVRANEKVLIHRPEDVPCYYDMQRFSVKFMAEKVPAFGYRVFQVTGRKKKSKSPEIISTSRKKSIQNEHLWLKVNKDGTFDIKHLKSRRIFKRINSFEDSGEAGDPWTRKKPQNDKIIYKPVDTPEIQISHSSLYSSIKVSFALKVPAQSDSMGRSVETEMIDIETVASLIKNTPWLTFQTRVVNRAEDHRLRVLFPSGIDTDKSFAETQFDIIERNKVKWRYIQRYLCMWGFFYGVSLPFVACFAIS